MSTPVRASTVTVVGATATVVEVDVVVVVTWAATLIVMVAGALVSAGETSSSLPAGITKPSSAKKVKSSVPTKSGFGV